jgi:hypothetical protein
VNVNTPEATIVLKTKVVIWLGKSLNEIAEYSFGKYVSNELEYPQARFLFSDMLILYTIKLMEFISTRYPAVWGPHKQ